MQKIEIKYVSVIKMGYNKTEEVWITIKNAFYQLKIETNFRTVD